MYFVIALIGNFHVALGLITLYLCFATFECTMVTSFGFWTKMLAHRSGTINALGWLAMGIGRVIADFTAAPIWHLLDHNFGFGRVSFIH
jgi:hypothetical protein